MTTFQTPLQIVGANGITGNNQTETCSFVRGTKVLSLGSSTSRQIVTLPPFSTLTGLSACMVSAPATDVSALNVNWGNSGQATRYGIIAVSALGQIRAATVSAAADFDASSTIVVTTSAVSTTTFTTGGVRAFIEYVTVA